MSTAKILKKSCTVAPANARENSFLRPMWPIDTIVLVTVVPIFAPITIGMAFAIERLPPATRPTTMDVVEEEDWIIEVARIPMNRPTIGFVVVAIRVSANPSPNNLREAPISSKLKRNRYKKHNRKIILKRTI